MNGKIILNSLLWYSDKCNVTLGGCCPAGGATNTSNAESVCWLYGSLEASF